MSNAMLLVVQTAPDVAQKIEPLTSVGWVLLIGSVGFVVILTVYCFYRVLTLPPESK